MKFKGVITINILELGLSQMYLSIDKINGVKSWFVPDRIMEYQALPVHDFGNGRYTLTDGHSRAYVAFRAGIDYIPVIYDLDAMVTNPTGQMLYKNDIVWCDRFGLKNISHLEKRFEFP